MDVTVRTASIPERREFSGIDLLFRPAFRFVKGYFLKRGYLDGYRGLIIAMLSAMGVFFKYAKLWEHIHARPLSPEASNNSCEGKAPPAAPVNNG